MFSSLQASNVTYRVRSGIDLNTNNPSAALVICPIDGNTLHCDGSVTVGEAHWKPPGRALMDVVQCKYLDWLALRFPAVLAIGLVLLCAGSRLKWKAKGGPKPMSLILGEVLLLIVVLLVIGLMLTSAACF